MSEKRTRRIKDSEVVKCFDGNSQIEFQAGMAASAIDFVSGILKQMVDIELKYPEATGKKTIDYDKDGRLAIFFYRYKTEQDS